MSERPEHLDNLGQLCHDGLDIARYLFQVPDDEGERDRVRAILKAILAEPSVKPRREMPKVVEGMQQALDGEASAMAAERLQEGFERLIRLSQAAKSGLF
ncbi:MAG: hypothetical protein IID05_01935 [Gemmatimonadetes bacterium]|nr:hypothetical protein [Gemmatimonadota bacterium]